MRAVVAPWRAPLALLLGVLGCVSGAIESGPEPENGPGPSEKGVDAAAAPMGTKDSAASPSPSPPPPDGAPPRDAAVPDTAPPPPNNDELFDPAQVPRFDLEIPQASIDQLNAVKDEHDPAQEIYV